LFDKLQDQELPVELLSPFFFAAPLAPLVAGRSLGQVVTRSAALARLREAGRRCELLLVEGCGGVLAPLGPGYFLVDLMAAFAAPAIITARNRLGVINHSLLSVKALREAGVQPALLMLMGCAKPDESASSNPALLRELLDPVPVFSMPFLGPKAASFRGVQEHAKKQKKRLADAAAAVKLTLSSGENRRAQRGRKFFEESC
jgi:dethiobiotin synthase